MTENGCKLLENGWKWLEMPGMAGNGRNGWTWLDMAGNDWKVLEMTGMADIAGNVWKQMETTGNEGDGWDRVYRNRNFLSSPSSNSAQNLIYVRARAEPSS